MLKLGCHTLAVCLFKGATSLGTHTCTYIITYTIYIIYIYVYIVHPLYAVTKMNSVYTIC